MGEREGLYQSGWSPRGVRPTWDRVSMGIDGPTAAVLHQHHVPDEWGQPVEVVAWFNEDDELRVLVADFVNGRRSVIRRTAKGWSTTFQRASQ